MAYTEPVIDEWNEERTPTPEDLKRSESNLKYLKNADCDIYLDGTWHNAA